jgi:aryl-alcohol dehydrogenase-like predicted oxidoreductase
MAAFALRWILMQDAVSVVIPGAKSPAQAQANVLADAQPAFSAATLQAARDVYTRLIAPHVAHSW